MTSSKKYVKEGDTVSSQAAHYLQWCHQQKPGVRIPWQDIAQALHGLGKRPARTNALVVAIARNSHNIGKVMREKYELSINTDRDGVRVLQTGEEIAEHDLARRTKEANLKVAKVSEIGNLALKRGFKDDAKGRALKKFTSRAVAGANTASNQLPTMSEVKGILVSGDD